MSIDDQAARLTFAMERAKIGSAAELYRSLDGREKRPALSTLRAYANGGRRAPLDVAIRIGRTLKVSGQWLFDGSGTIDDPNPLPRSRLLLPRSRTPAFFEVPLVSWVSAGDLVDPGHIANETEALIPVSGLGAGDYFALKVKGDSMDLLSPEGSTIIVDRSRRTLRNDYPYVVINGSETTYKLWNSELHALQPWSSNKMHRPIPVRDNRFHVIGQVRRTMLDFG